MLQDDILVQFGKARRSGRYEWGSGDNPQRSGNIYSRIEDLKKKGITSEVEISKALGMNTKQLRAEKSRAFNESRNETIKKYSQLVKEGKSQTYISNELGVPESTLRSYSNIKTQSEKQIGSTMNALKGLVDKHEYLDIGAGSEIYMGISRTKLNNAVSQLVDHDAYEVKYIQVDQLGTISGQKTTIKLLTKEGVQTKDIYANKEKIAYPTMQSEDGGLTYSKFHPVKMQPFNKVAIKYAEDGGADRDGLMLIRKGAEDLSLGNATYAQVRIGVGGTHYLKGMAMYDNDNIIPKGQDILFYTNKSKSKSKEEVLKPLKDQSATDPSKMFGSSVAKQRGSLNIVNEEGSWYDWNGTFSSQMLSKQRPSLVKSQLEETLNTKKKIFDEAMSINNPTVRKKLLESISEDMDASAEHLKVAGLPRTAQHVILPFPELKENEVYAPKYKNGERIVLIRHPHGGIFEIPELIVNNKQPSVRKALGNAKDALGINPKTAGKLSGADFDGDSVIAIPNNNGTIKHAPSLTALKNFNPSEAYPAYEGMVKITSKRKEQEMGRVSNLITDMTLKGADVSELARAVKHSMVVIDSEKHNLDYKTSEKDNAIKALKQKYQGGANRGASTLISKASSEERVDERKFKEIDKKTGEKIFELTGNTYINVDGKEKKRQTISTKMAETKDARTLSSGTEIEEIYAKYANELKSLANKARKEMVNTPNLQSNPQAKLDYAKEVHSLNAKLNVARSNKPKERRAQIIANNEVKTIKADNPEMSKEEYKKLKGRTLTSVRLRTGAKKETVDITELEWEAIQKGAISNNKLKEILNNANMDKVKELALPRPTVSLSNAKLAKAESMKRLGRTQAQIAEALGVSVSTLNKALAQ